MSKNTTIFILLQKFNSQYEIAGILEKFCDFEDAARKCDVPTLLNFLVGATFEWKNLRYASDVPKEKDLANK